MHRLFALLPLTILLSACAGGMSGTPAPPPFDPSGVYDALVEVQGTAMPATLTITATPDGYTGTMSMVDVGMNVTLADLSVADPEVTFWVNAQDGRYLVSLTFAGDDFTGYFESDAMGGNLSGTKRR